jgi:uncharacterized protein (DUF1697 family)
MTGRRYIAFLRAVNVGGRFVRMADLKRLFEKLGFDDVATFIGSGNIIFGSTNNDPAKLEVFIERALEKALGYQVATLLRTLPEVADVAQRDPFGKPIPKGGRLFVGFLRAAPPPAIRRKIAAMSTKTDTFQIQGRELYWLCAVPLMQSIAAGGKLEKTVAMPATFRNVNTVRRLAAKYPPA